MLCVGGCVCDVSTCGSVCEVWMEQCGGDGGRAVQPLGEAWDGLALSLSSLLVQVRLQPSTALTRKYIFLM